MRKEGNDLAERKEKKMKSSKKLSIVQMNDSHAYFDLHQEMFWQGDHAVCTVPTEVTRAAFVAV